MEITLLIKSIVGLVLVLGGLLFLLFYSRSMKEKQDKNKMQAKPKKEHHDLASLRKIIRDKKTPTAKLQETLNLVIEHHGTISDFDFYAEILFTICRHPNTNKDIILNFDRALEAKNPEYKREINDAITNGLNSRGA
jgi:hypothetical protein